jgi:hypothetical protein
MDAFAASSPQRNLRATRGTIPASNRVACLPARSLNYCGHSHRKFKIKPSPGGAFMVRRLSILLGLVFLISISAQAQDRVEVFGGYSFQRYGGAPARTLNGWELSAKYKLAPWVGLVADLDGQYGLPSLPDIRTVHFLAGPQFSIPGRISPFVHVLGGFGHLHENSGQTSFAGAFGGGVDLRIAPLFSWRVIQADDVATRFFGGTQHSLRLSTGLVFRF